MHTTRTTLTTLTSPTTRTTPNDTQMTTKPATQQHTQNKRKRGRIQPNTDTIHNNQT